MDKLIYPLTRYQHYCRFIFINDSSNNVTLKVTLKKVMLIFVKSYCRFKYNCNTYFPLLILLIFQLIKSLKLLLLFTKYKQTNQKGCMWVISPVPKWALCWVSSQNSLCRGSSQNLQLELSQGAPSLRCKLLKKLNISIEHKTTVYAFSIN